MEEEVNTASASANPVFKRTPPSKPFPSKRTKRCFCACRKNISLLAVRPYHKAIAVNAREPQQPKKPLRRAANNYDVICPGPHFSKGVRAATAAAASSLCSVCNREVAVFSPFFFLIGGAAGVNLYGERGGSSFLGSLRFWGEWRSLELIGPLPGLRYACSGVGRGKQDLLGFREWLREAAAQLALSLLGVPGSIRTFRQRASGSEDMKLGMPLKDKRKVTGVILRAAIRPRTLSQ